jgi:hypothetical protein
MATPNLCIAIGDPNPPYNHLPLLRREAANSTRVDFDWWNLHACAAPGDEVVFYLIGPISAFVALGTVGERVRVDDPRLSEADRNSLHLDENCFWIRNVRVLPQPFRTIGEARISFQDWGYLFGPLAPTCVPCETVGAFLAFLGAPLLLQIACDVSHPPPQMTVTTSRYIRDTEMTREVKRLRRFKCQIPGCVFTMRHPNGEEFIEAHHIHPLGRGGNDNAGNILCVCPNHHAELDYCVRQLLAADFPSIEGHAIVQDNIDYHNNLCQNEVARNHSSQHV